VTRYTRAEKEPLFKFSLTRKKLIGRMRYYNAQEYFAGGGLSTSLRGREQFYIWDLPERRQRLRNTLAESSSLASLWSRKGLNKNRRPIDSNNEKKGVRWEEDTTGHNLLSGYLNKASVQADPLMLT